FHVKDAIALDATAWCCVNAVVQPAAATIELAGNAWGGLLAAKTELTPLTGLRFAAAFAILFQHTMQWCVPFNDGRVTGTAAAAIGVYRMPLFFVLSGFVLHYNYGLLFRKQSYTVSLRDFFGARFARLYPLFIFFCLFGVVSDFTADWIGYAPRTFLSYFVHE